MKNQILFNEKLYQLRKILEKAAKSRADMKTEISWLTDNSKTRNQEYIKETIEPAIENLKTQIKILGNQLYAETCEKLREIEALTENDHISLDLNKPEWTNALKLIEMAGPNISGDLARQINASFANDQPSLKALQQIYKEKGVKYDGGLDKQISSPFQYEYLRDYAFSSLVQDISLNSFAHAIDKVVKREGFEFAPITNDDGVFEVTSIAVGLPVTPLVEE
jgi:hypothetical protein